jgi:hypothetical protein
MTKYASIRFGGLIAHVRLGSEVISVMQVGDPPHKLTLSGYVTDFAGYDGFDYENGQDLKFLINGSLALENGQPGIEVLDEFETYVPHITQVSTCTTLDQKVLDKEIVSPFVCFLSTTGGQWGAADFFRYRAEFRPRIQWPGVHCIPYEVNLRITLTDDSKPLKIYDVKKPNERFIKVQPGKTVYVRNDPVIHDHPGQPSHFESHYKICSDYGSAARGLPYEREDFPCPLHNSAPITSVECSNSQFP